MARSKIEIDKKVLQTQINAVETAAEGGKFTSRTALFAAVAETPWAKDHQPPISASIIASRFKEYKLKAETPVSKPGRPKGSKNKAVAAESTPETPVAVGAAADIETVAVAGDEKDID